MKIGTSAVSMNAQRSYKSYVQKESMTMETKAEDHVRLDLSKESKSLFEQIKNKKAEMDRKNQKEELQQKRELQKKESLKEYNDSNALNKYGGMQFPWSDTMQIQGAKLLPEDSEDIQIKMLKAVLKLLAEARIKSSRCKTRQNIADSFDDFLQTQMQKPLEILNKNQMMPFGGLQSGIIGNGVVEATPTIWERTTVASVFYSESETTAYKANGIVKTEDGRELSFGVTMEMSRDFCARYESYTQQSYLMTDPLVIHLDSYQGTLSDQKFLFDLDADGKKEEISHPEGKSGFLALDKNKDGIINNGKELFGPQTGNGFEELSVYDEDENGWIDENDLIYNDLRIWMKDEAGNDRLITLKEGSVGAIYLSSSKTEFALKNQETNETKGKVQRTGIFLKENGEAGTIQHIDLAT